MELPKGVYPTMVTPMHPDGGVDYGALDGLTDWFLDARVAGLFTVCQSSEMFLLTPEERLQVATRVKQRAGDVPVVACGTFGGTIAAQAGFVRELAKVVDAVVCVTGVLVAADEDDAVLLGRLRELADLTPGVPLGLYECPKPYHRVLAPATLAAVAATGRFVFHKDTSRDPEAIRAKIDALRVAPTHNMWFFNGNVATLYRSLLDGGDGFSGISCNFYPWLHVWLVSHPTHEHAPKVHTFLAVAENTAKDCYPLSAKTYHMLFYGGGRPAARSVTTPLLPEQIVKLSALHAMMSDVCSTVGIHAAPDSAPSSLEH